MLLSKHPSCASGYPNAGFDIIEVPTIQEAALAMTGTVYSACIWAGGSRGATRFRSADFCVLDFDETLTKLEAMTALAGYCYALGPSPNDGKDKVNKAGEIKPARDRFRILMPFKQRIYDAEVYEYNMRRFVKRFDADRLPIDAGRIWQPSTKIEILTAMGEFLDVVEVVPLEETQSFKEQKRKDFAETRAKGHCMPREVRSFVNGKIPPGSRNDMLFKSACYFFQTGMTVEQFRELVYSKIPAIQDHDKLETTIKSAAKRTGASYF